MTDRTDHAAEARRLIELSSIQPDVDSASAVAQAAQVHAQLALVEQQRIANLIALANVAGDPELEVSPTEQAAWDTLGEKGTGQIRPDVAAALGIETSQ